MKPQRPLGWWDTGSTLRTHTKRCANQHSKCVGLLSLLKEHPDYQQIFEFTWQVLNLAADKSALGQEEVSKQLQKRLRRALEQIANGQLSFAEVQSLSASAKALTSSAAADVETALIGRRRR